MAQERNWLYLEDDEEVLWSDHPSIWTVFPYVVVGIVMVLVVMRLLQLLPLSNVAIGPFPLSVLAFLTAVLAGAAPAMYALARRRTTLYVITTNEIWFKQGIFRRDSVDMLDVTKVADREYSQSIFDRLVNKGDFEIMSKGTGEVEMTFWDVPNPAEVYEVLRKAEEKGRKQRGQERTANTSDQNQRPPGSDASGTNSPFSVSGTASSPDPESDRGGSNRNQSTEGPFSTATDACAVLRIDEFVTDYISFQE